MSKISNAQLKRLQTLWSQHARHEMITNSREERLRWANAELKNSLVSAISSFRDLTNSEASTLINALQSLMGIKESRSPRSPRRRLDRDQAQAAGTEGRRGSRKTMTLATAEDFALIDEQLKAMGWDRSRLEAFLNSPSSPLRGRLQLRTVADVNRVLWPLRRIARNAKKTSEAV